jgi:hypothetical protein
MLSSQLILKFNFPLFQDGECSSTVDRRKRLEKSGNAISWGSAGKMNYNRYCYVTDWCWPVLWKDLQKLI